MGTSAKRGLMGFDRVIDWGRGTEITEQYFLVRLTFVSADETLKCCHGVATYLVVFVCGTLV